MIASAAAGFVVSPGAVPRFPGPQGREADFTEILASRSQTGATLGIAHTFENVGTKPGVLLVGVTPGGFEKLFEERQGVDAETHRALMKTHHMEVVGPPLR